MEAALHQYFHKLGRGDLSSMKQFDRGQSNPTYLLSFTNGDKMVLRKPPVGKLLDKSAHNIGREYKVMVIIDYCTIDRL